MSNIKKLKYKIVKSYYENVDYKTHRYVMKAKKLKDKVEPNYQKNVQEGRAIIKAKLFGRKKHK